MASRNLTKKFIELRNGAKASRNLGMRDESDGESGLLKVKNSCSTLIHQTDAALTFYNFYFQKSNEAEWRNNRHTLPPEWVERIEVVEEDITKIKSRSKCIVFDPPISQFV